MFKVPPPTDALESVCIGHFRFECPHETHGTLMGAQGICLKKRETISDAVFCAAVSGWHCWVLLLLFFLLLPPVIHKVFGAMHSFWFRLGALVEISLRRLAK